MEALKSDSTLWKHGVASFGSLQAKATLYGSLEVRAAPFWKHGFVYSVLDPNSTKIPSFAILVLILIRGCIQMRRIQGANGAVPPLIFSGKFSYHTP